MIIDLIIIFIVISFDYYLNRGYHILIGERMDDIYEVWVI